MANTQYPETGTWVLDTAAVVVAAGKDVSIQAIEFIPAATDDVLDLQDGNSKPFVYLKAIGDAKQIPRSWDPARRLDGLKVATLTAGAKVRVFLSKV